MAKIYYIITIGCQMNKSDSERVAGYLEKSGYKVGENYDQADLVVINTCGVRQSAEDRVYGLVPKIKKSNPDARIVLTGCLIGRQDVKKRLLGKVDFWLPIVEIPRLKRQITNKSQASNLQLKGIDYLKLAPKYSSRVSAYVPIGNGCNNFCAYCVVPYARGREVYRPAEDIIKEAKELVKNKYKEIILIAQNVNSYKDSQAGINFAGLLKKIKNIEGDFWISFATSHPKDMSDELINVVAKSKKICKHIHLPAQSGDNGILEKMNRGYTIEHYKNLIKKIRRAIPNASITTDIIVGFPGETRRQFENTKKLFKEIKFDMAYIARYSPRPGTAAYKIKDDVSAKEKKKREAELMKILSRTARANNKKYLNKTVAVLVSVKNKKGEWLGRSNTDKNIILEASGRAAGLLGKFVKVKITEARDFGLRGKLIK